jgi:excinuclease ABC subunit A
MKGKKNTIRIEGARVHNLKNIDLDIPRNELVVITGLSGSGKSSLAFDTIYAEGQRRYMETFSAYVRQFLGNMERPDVDKIDGLSPVIAIEQKTTSKSPRSTVGTITELYDYIRLLFARVGTAYSYVSNQKMVSYTEEQIQNLIVNDYFGKKVILLAPVIKSRKGHYRELFDSLSRQGFSKVRIDGQVFDLTPGMKVDRYKTHDIELVIDRFTVKKDEEFIKRLNDSLITSLHYGQGIMMVMELKENKARYFSRNLMCPTSGIAYPIPEPNTFSFNSPKGMCPSCNGLGVQHKVNLKKIIPDDSISITQGGLAPLGTKKSSWTYRQIETIAKCYDFSLTDPINKIPKRGMEVILKGSQEKFDIPSTNLGITRSYKIDFEGLEHYIESSYEEAATASIKRWASSYMESYKCNSCKGSRLRKEALFFKLNNANIANLVSMDLQDLFVWISELDSFLNENEKKIAKEILKEIRVRLQFLLDVGLDYLQLNRSSKSLSGGEAQRIRLATQIGSQLVGVLYILDEPSIGLHQRDNDRLIHSLMALRDLGNSVLVVEHDKEIMLRADYLIDMGPYAGKNGGEIISQGKPEETLNEQTLTNQYLTGDLRIKIPKDRRKKR